MSSNTQSKYSDKVHLYGRMITLFCIFSMIAAPIAICYKFDIFPPIEAVLKGLMALLPVMAPTAILEAVAYTPILGTGATYLSFITGNVSNMKIPVVTSAIDAAEVSKGSEEAEVISTIASGVSSLIVIGLLAFLVMFADFFTPIITYKPIQPAFSNIMPAVFGSLLAGLVFKEIKLALPVLLFSVVLVFTGVPSSLALPLCAVFSLAIGRTMYKKDLIKNIK